MWQITYPGYFFSEGGREKEGGIEYQTNRLVLLHPNNQVVVVATVDRLKILESPTKNISLKQKSKSLKI